MSTKVPSTRRRGAEAREEAVEAARLLLLEGGPSAVTLKAVGQRMGVGHANLIHHFGSAAGLQAALMERMVRDLAERVGAGLADLKPGELGQRAILDVVFDAFDAGGAAQVAAWLALERQTERAEGLAEVVRHLADSLAGLAPEDADAQAKARALVIQATYMAFADALIGPVMRGMLDLPREWPRDLAQAAAAAVISGTGKPGGGG